MCIVAWVPDRVECTRGMKNRGPILVFELEKVKSVHAVTTILGSPDR